MVAIFTGLGAGFAHGSATNLGGMGLLGSASLGRAGEGVSINGETGNLVLTQQDEFLAGLGLDASVARTYNSVGALNENGDGWRQSTDRRMVLSGTANATGSTVTQVLADGSTVLWSWNGSAYTASDLAAEDQTLSYSSGTSTWTWRDNRGHVTETYKDSDSGYISTRADDDGNTLAYAYVSAGKLDKITTQDGAYIQYSWTGTDITQIVTHYTDLVTMTAKTLTRTSYAYDTQHRLTSVTVDLSPEDNSVSDGKVYTTTYAYVGTTNYVSTISQTDGSSLAISYDGSNRVSQLVLTAASGDTRTTTLAYFSDHIEVTDPRSQVTKVYFAVSTSGAIGEMTKVIAPPATTGATGQTVQYAYDAAGHLTQVTDALGKITTYTYDANGNVATITDPNSVVTTKSYDTNNNLTLITVTGSNASSSSTSLYTRYVYDAENHLRFTISAEGRVQQYSYNANGTLQYTIDYPDSAYSTIAPPTLPTETQMASWVSGLTDLSNTEICKYIYDARGGLTQSTHYSAASSAGVEATTEGYAQTNYVYDQAGRLLSQQTNPQGTLTYVYDGLGRLVGSTDLNGGTTTIVFNDGADTTTVTTAASFTTVSTYNKAGELQSVTTSGTNTTGGTQNFVYDKNGNVRKVTDATGKISYAVYDKAGRKIASVGQNGELTEYKYDADNHLIASVAYNTLLNSTDLTALAGAPAADYEFGVNLTRPSAVSTDLWSWTIYDAGGRVAETIGGDGAVVAYAYDSANRLVATTAYANKLTSTQISTFITTPPTTVTLPTADSSHDIYVRTFYDGDGNVVGALNAEGYLSQILYDNAGRKIQTIVYANATTTTYRASGTFAQNLGTITADATKDISTRFVYDGQGLLRFTIDALKHVTELVYRVGTDTDANGQVRETIGYAAALGTVANYNYATIKTAVAALANASNDRASYAVYDSAGRLAYSLDATGGLVAYAYDTMGRVTKTTAYATLYTSALSAGADSTWKATLDTWVSTHGVSTDRIGRTYYSERGDVLFSVDAEGYVTGFVYDAEGRVTTQNRYPTALSLTDSSTLATVIAASKGTPVATTFSYDAFGRVSDIYDPLGTHTQKTYYANGLVQDEIIASGQGRDETKTHNTYDQAGHLVTSISAYGATEAATTTYAYDGLGQVASVTDPLGHATSFTYDKAGHVLTKTDALSGVTQYQYDAFGNVVKTIDVRGNASFAYYDQADRVVLTVDAENYATKTVYTVFGEVQNVTRYVTRVTGTPVVGTQPTITTNASDATTAFVYDKLLRVTQTTDAASASESTAWNAFGQRSSFTNKLGATTTYSYDHRGLLTSQVDPIVVKRSDGTTEASSLTTTFAYDSRGNRTQMVEASGLSEQRTTTYAYDAADQLISQAGNAVSVASSATASLATVTPTTQYFYDRRGSVIETIDPAGAKTLIWYDKLGRVSEQVSPLGTVTTFTYDAAGNVLEKKIYATQITPPTDASGTAPTPTGAYRSTQYVYDNLNRVTQVKTPSIEIGYFSSVFTVPSSPTPTLTTTYQYDAAGNVVKTTDANSNVTWDYYDKVGNKTTEIDALNYRTDWTYDTNNNVLTETRYANAGTTPTGVSAPPSLPTLDNTNDRITIFTYDKMGRRLTETRGDSAASRGLVAVNNSASPGTTTNVAATITYTYNALGEVASKAEATGNTTTYTYDTMGRLTTEAHASFTDVNGNTVTPTLTYSYDGLGNLVRTVDSGAAGTISAADRVTTSSYDIAGHLLANTDASGFVHTFRYDAAGRIVRDEYFRQKADGTTAHEAQGTDYDAEGHVTRQGVMIDTDSSSTDVWSRAGAGLDTTAMSYNAFGEIAQRGYFHDISGVQTTLYDESFSYDAAGRLWATTAGDGTSKYFMYDANGNQTLMVASTGTDIAGKANIDAVLALWTSNTAVGTTYVAGIVATITRYDARNQAIEAKEPQRELNTTTKSDLSTTRAYNAFGEVTYEIDANSNRIDYTYNTMGRLMQTTSPSVQGVGENGLYITGYSGFTPNATSSTATTFRPVEYKYYDASGRQVAQRDANGNLTQYTLLAGTGYGKAQALVTQVKTADNATINTLYDIHGDARTVRDQLWTSGTTHADVQSFDAMGRLTELDHSGGLIDYYQYDGLGQRIYHWNNLLNPTNSLTSVDTEKTIFDQEGRIISQSQFGGDTITHAFVWDGTIADMGLTFGGWTETVTYPIGVAFVETDDAFGRAVVVNDLGHHVANLTYDKGGRVTKRAGGEDINYSYFNTGRTAAISGFMYGSMATHVSWEKRTQSFGYDKLGNVVSEGINGEVLTWINGGTGWDETDYTYVYENATATFDGLGRLTSWAEAGNDLTAAASLTYLYDANSNIRRSLATYKALDAQGNAATSTTTQDYWFKYDALNRVVTSKGALSGGAIVRSTTGMDLLYNAGGQRIQSLITSGSQTRREDYTFNADNTLDHVYYATGTGTPAQGPLVADFDYDLMGRLTHQGDVNTSGALQYSRDVTYNDKSQVTTDTTITLHTTTLYKAVNTYDYGSGSTYELGQPNSITTVNYESTNSGATWTQKKTNSNTFTYAWYDGPITASSAYKPDISLSTTYTSTYSYNLMGGKPDLTKVAISDGRPRTATFISDRQGHVIRRDEVDNSTGGDPHENWYRYSGRQVGYVGNNGTYDVDYTTSDTDRTATAGTGAFQNGATSSTSYADFDQSIAHIDTFYQGSLAGTYTAQGGETLSALASQLWGDSSLWYKLAEANGMASDATLEAGTIVHIPPGVMRSSNTATTFQPYDPNAILGNVSPTTPKPPKSSHNCGVIGQILLVVIAVVVTIYTAGAASAAFSAVASGATAGGVVTAAVNGGLAAFGTMGAVGAVTAGGIAAGAIGGAVGSIVSQAVGVATGIQDKFSWSAVGLAAIGGGIGASGELGIGGSNFVSTAERAVVANVATQGIAMATGLQGKFSWAGVAGAAVGASLGKYVRDTAGAKLAGAFGDQLANGVIGAANALGNAAARSLVDGSDFGDNVMAALPDVIGQTIGNAIAGGISRTGRSDSDYASVLKDRFAYDGDTQLPLNQVPGAYQEAGTSQSSHRNFWDWVLDVTGLGDGLFGDDHARPGSLHFDLSNLGAAIHNLGRQSDEIVVTGHRIIREVPISFAHGITDSVHKNITQPIVAMSNGIAHIARDPGGYGVQTLRGLPGALDNTFDRLDRFDPDALINNRLAHYSAAARADGAPGFANALSYDAGYAMPLAAPLAAGPYGVGAEYGLTTEDAMLFSLRPRLTQLEMNSASGAAFQARVNAFGSATLDNFVGEVSIRPNTAVGPADFRIRIDGLGTTADSGVIELLEAKGSATAPLTPNQTDGFPLLQRYGGSIVGGNGGPVYPAGTPIPQGTIVRVIRPADLPPGY